MGVYRELAGLAKRSQGMALPIKSIFLVYFVDRIGDFLGRAVVTIS
jgi:hypothetical protein